MSSNRQSRSIDVASILGACGKKRYSHKREAEETMQQQIERAAERGDALELRVYRCPKAYCGGWHLTSRRSR